MNISQNKAVLTFTSLLTSGYAYVHYLSIVNVADEEILHSEITPESSTYTLTLDSYYKVAEIKLPDTAGAGYYILGDAIYAPGNVLITEEELLAVDPNGTNIIRQDLDLVSIYFLNSYYIDLLGEKFLKNICSCACISNKDKAEIDTFTMGITLIESLTANQMFYEADRIIDSLSKCANLPTDSSCNCYG